MGRLVLTEDDKKEVMSNYFGEFNQKFYDFPAPRGKPTISVSSNFQMV